MTSHRVTASSLPRIFRCPASAALPAVAEPNQWSDLGNSDHKYIARVAEEGIEKAAEVLAEFPADEHRGLAEIELEALPLDRPHEVAFAYDPLTGEARLLGRGLARDYTDAESWEVPGTADVAGHEVTNHFGHMVGLVRDYKLGYGWAPEVDGHEQLLFLALSVARAFGAGEVSIGLIFPRGNSPEQTAMLDAADLAKFERKLLGVLEQVRVAHFALADGVMPDVSMGPWCKYCPATNVCPGQTGLIRSSLDPNSQVALTSAIRDLSPEDLGQLYGKAKLATDILGKLMQRIKAIVISSETAIPIGEGRVLAPRSINGRAKIDGAKAWEIVCGNYGEDAATAAVTMQASTASIKRAVKVGGARNVAGATRDIIQLLKDDGAYEPGATRIEAKEVNE